MAKLIEKVTLVCYSIEKNNKKQWIGELYDNGDVITRWGLVGGTLDSKTFPNAGVEFLRKKEKEKLRPKKDKESYTRALTVDDINASSVILSPAQNDLAQIAKEQLAKHNPTLSALIDRLVKANVHNIVSQTSITYNSTSGLFQTPLGVIRQEGLDQARDMLVEIKKSMIKKDSKLAKLVSDYCRVIPQRVGHKFTVESIFPDLEAIQKQSNILDSLEATLAAMTTPKNDGVTKTEKPKLFEVDLDVLTDKEEQERLEKFYSSTMKSMHGYNHIKIQQFYKIKIHNMYNNFDETLGNVYETFHGTGMGNILSILKSGLKVSPPSTAFIAGKMWSNGVYGAIHSSKSLGYTFGKWGGRTGESGWLAVCDFAMGNIEYPTHSGRNYPSKGFDSVWAKPEKTGLLHDELVVYKDNQINIKYLLEVK